MQPPDTRWLDDDTGIIDLNFTGVPKVISAYLLRTDDGLAVVDIGPTSVMDTLIAGIRALGHAPNDVRHILVTHIHLDHAGAAGTWMRQLPDVRLYVHEIGAPHMFDPTNLIRSATRIYGDDMERLWGEFLPVSVERTTVLSDGDRLQIGGRILDVVYTPGHASHHVTFFEPASRLAFVGDVGGIRIPPSALPIPPTPPPDILVETWKESIARLRALRPSRLLLAHFGAADDVDSHLTELEANLDAFVALAVETVADGLDRDVLVTRLSEHVHEQLRSEGHADVEQQMGIASPLGMAADGLLRYLRKRDETRSSLSRP